MRTFTFVAVLLLLGNGTAFAFDCAEVKLPSSLVICSEPELMRLADERQEAFNQAMARLDDQQQKQLLVDQSGWVKSYASACGVPQNAPPPSPVPEAVKSCFKRAGEARIAYLRGYGAGISRSASSPVPTERELSTRPAPSQSAEQAASASAPAVNPTRDVPAALTPPPAAAYSAPPVGSVRPLTPTGSAPATKDQEEFAKNRAYEAGFRPLGVRLPSGADCDQPPDVHEAWECERFIFEKYGTFAGYDYQERMKGYNAVLQKKENQAREAKEKQVAEQEAQRHSVTARHISGMAIPGTNQLNGIPAMICPNFERLEGVMQLFFSYSGENWGRRAIIRSLGAMASEPPGPPLNAADFGCTAIPDGEKLMVQQFLGPYYKASLEIDRKTVSGVIRADMFTTP